jgi:cob(I)alamin adenosyltransferase
MAMKIYTKTGDDGTTGLIGGRRVSKCDCRIECVGKVDELNAAVGLAAVAAVAEQGERLRAVQHELFTIGSHLAVGESGIAPKDLPALSEEMIERLEREIDGAEAELPPLRNFILPGGGEAASRLHVARTACRAAEREVVKFAQQRTVPQIVLIYLNRLSDWLFVQARWANLREGIADVLWKP